MKLYCNLSRDYIRNLVIGSHQIVVCLAHTRTFHLMSQVPNEPYVPFVRLLIMTLSEHVIYVRGIPPLTLLS